MKYILVSFIILFSACSSEVTEKTLDNEVTTKEVTDILVRNTGETQGTFYHIQYISEGGKDYKQQVDSLLLEIDFSLSTYKEYSLISRLNKGEKVKVDNFFEEVFYAAKKVYQ